MKSPYAVRIALLLSSFFSVTASAEEAPYISIEDQSNLHIKTPALQGRKSAKIQLRNGLEAYIISDPEIKQSAAALAVHVGSWNDPHEYPGMAHFCEHMVFMGSEKYPDENEIFRFVFDNGGILNAYTAPDRTVYMFSINNDAFTEGLDRFARFFIDPIFHSSGIARELNAVDQEHQKNVEHDGWREWMIFKEIGNSEHPNHLFSTGNAKTLGHIPRDRLVSWYQSHYSSEKMKLVVYTNRSIDSIKTDVLTSFDEIPMRKSDPQTLPHLMSKEQQGHIAYIEPIRDMRRLNFTWELPQSMSSHEDLHHAKLIAYTLSNKSENSLFEYLKKEGLVEDQNADVEVVASGALLFQLSYDLTHKGLRETDKIIAKTYENIGLMKQSGLPIHLFQEKRAMAENTFDFQSRTDAFDFVSKTAHILVDEPIATFPRLTLIQDDFKQQRVQEITAHLDPSRCFYTLIAPEKHTGVKATQKEQWLGGEYSIAKIHDEKLRSWQETAPTGEFGLPYPNPYIPHELSLSSEIVKKEISPILISDDAKGKIYYARDTEYHVPEVAIHFSFKSPLINGQAEHLAMLDLYNLLITKKLSPTLSQAARGGLKMSMTQDGLSMHLNIWGFSPKSKLLLNTTLQELRQFRCTPEEFSIAKQELASLYDQKEKTLPFYVVNEMMASIIYTHKPLPSDLHASLDRLTVNDFQTFADSLFEFNFIEGMIVGDLEESEAKSLWSSCKEKLQFSTFAKSEFIPKNILSLPQQSGPYLIQKNSAMAGNVALLMVQDSTYSTEKHASMRILSRVLQEAFFSTLRTKQQTGYIAKSWAKESEGQLLYFFGVQSASHQPEDLLARYELFLEDFVREFDTHIGMERFNNVKNMQITTLQTPPQNLPSKAELLAKLAFEKDGDFKYVDKQIQALQELEYEAFKANAISVLSRSNKKRFAIQLYGKPDRENHFKYEALSKERILELGEYTSNH